MEGNGSNANLIRLVINYDTVTGALNCVGPCENEPLVLWLLEKAKDNIKAFNAAKAASGIVGASALPPNMRA